jgi:Spy/CpxP family protein refolding chaperone
MKKMLQLCLLLALACTGVNAQQVTEVNLQQTLPATQNNKVIRLAPGTSKQLPMLFTVATKTQLFLNIADELGLSQEQRAALKEINDKLQAHAEKVKLSYEQENEKLHSLLSSDNIELDNMRANLLASEQLKAEMQYHLFEALLRATNVLTPEQKQKVLGGVKMSLDELN